MTLTVGSLFSGIGGLDLGLERAGMRVIWQSEIDPYASRVLKKHWPEVPNYGDISRINWRIIRRPDVLAGGYPCQPFSTAGKRQGHNDPRHLWPLFRTAISELRPRYAILENVRGHLTLGGLSVVGDLANLGYDAEWRIISAAGVGAPHRRDRLIIVAYPTVIERDERKHVNFERTTAKWEAIQIPPRRSSSDVADATGRVRGLSKPHCLREAYEQTAEPRKSGGGSGPVGNWWKTEPNVGRVANGVPARVDRLRGLGNAVVPQVAEYVGRLVMEHAEQCE